MSYRFLIHVSYAYGIPIGRPLVRELERQGHQYRWFTDVEATGRRFTESDPVLHHPRDVTDYDPHIILSASNTVPDFFPGLKVQLFHGFSIHKRDAAKGHFRTRGLFDLYCTHGPSTTEPFQELAQQHRHFAVRETGWSKVDPLFPLPPSAQNEPACILVSSTFTPRLSLVHDSQMMDELYRLTRSDRFRWLLIAHPLMNPSVVEGLKALQKDNVTFHDTTDLTPIFQQADIMVSDTTSVIPEFLLQKKPVISFKNTTPREHLINISVATELEQAIETALAPSDELLMHIDRYLAHMHPYTDGHSSRRVIDTCIDYLHSDKSQLKPKPLNLFRKLKIRKSLGYWTLRSYRRAPTLPKP